MRLWASKQRTACLVPHCTDHPEFPPEFGVARERDMCLGRSHGFRSGHLVMSRVSSSLENREKITFASNLGLLRLCGSLRRHSQRLFWEGSGSYVSVFERTDSGSGATHWSWSQRIFVFRWKKHFLTQWNFIPWWIHGKDAIITNDRSCFWNCILGFRARLFHSLLLT